MDITYDVPTLFPAGVPELGDLHAAVLEIATLDGILLDGDVLKVLGVADGTDIGAVETALKAGFSLKPIAADMVATGTPLLYANWKIEYEPPLVSPVVTYKDGLMDTRTWSDEQGRVVVSEEFTYVFGPVGPTHRNQVILWMDADGLPALQRVLPPEALDPMAARRESRRVVVGQVMAFASEALVANAGGDLAALADGRAFFATVATESSLFIESGDLSLISRIQNDVSTVLDVPYGQGTVRDGCLAILAHWVI